MQSNLTARVTGFSEQVERFAARWHQLKPSEEMLEQGLDKCSEALVTLKDRRQEFNQLKSGLDTLRYVSTIRFKSHTYVMLFAFSLVCVVELTAAILVWRSRPFL